MHVLERSIYIFMACRRHDKFFDESNLLFIDTWHFLFDKRFRSSTSTNKTYPTIHTEFVVRITRQSVAIMT